MKKKNCQLIFKAVVLLLSLIVMVFVGSLAWFTTGQTSYANGINIRSQADGIQVSWNGEDYYDNLTELDESKVIAGVTGPALNITGEENTPATLKLVTGNGLSFFEPYLNRRTGTVLTEGNLWLGNEITDDNSQGRYIDIPLYFRGTSSRDVYLAGNSKVSPKLVDGHYSDYGPFSKDYIAAASRVAFLDLDSEEKSCAFIWAPNADVELVENDNGYTKFTTTEEEEVTVSSGGDDNIDGGVVDNGKTYYFWTFWDDSVVGAYPNDLSKFEARKFEYDSERRYFVTEVTTWIPTYGGENPSIPIFINESPSASATSFNSYNTYIDGASSKNTIKESKGQYFGVTNTSFNIGSATCSNAMYIINRNIKPNSKITYELGYDPYNKLLVILSYQVVGGGSFSLGGEGTEITTTVTYYPLCNDGNVECALVSPQDSVAVSTGVNNKKAVLFKDSDKMNVMPISVTLSEQFIAEKIGDGYAATFKFKNKKSSKYLTIGSDGKVSFTDSNAASAFSLYYDSNFEGPLLKTGDYYLVVQNGSVIGVKLGNLDISEAVTVYTGSTYQLNTGLTLDSQVYQYYNHSATTPSLVSLGPATSPKLFTSTASTPASVKIGDTKIATLTKASEDDEYFTAKITMRIWVEGTDREAKTPLADGIFDASFHFVSQ